MKEFENRTKVMVGDDAIDRIGYDVYYNNHYSALIIYDSDSDICGSKRKLKRILGRSKTNTTYVRVDVGNVATWKNVKRCYDIWKECKADYIICVGTSVVADIGKAVKVLVCMNRDNFEGLEKVEFNDELQLVVVPISAGDHASLASGNFVVYDEQKDYMYKFSCKSIYPTAVAIDSRVLDKVSDTAMLLMEINAVCMSFAGLVDCQNDNNRICSMIAIDIVNKAFEEQRPMTLVEAISSQMFAGISYFNIEENLLDEFVCQAMVRSGASYDDILLNVMVLIFNTIISQIDTADMKMIGNVFGAEFKSNNVAAWQKTISQKFEKKINQYFENKNAVRGLRNLGINANDIECIFAEILKTYGYGEMSEKGMTYKVLFYNSL